MINIFAIAPNDASMSYLAKIFGSVNGIIAINGQPLGQSTNILSSMFKTFNSMVLAVAVLVLVYTTVVGVIATAHEGEFMGKRWNNIWIPLRVVFGVGLLVPTGSGYCGLQILIMWVIVQGIGAADMVWNTALTYLQLAGSPYAQVGIPSADATAKFNGLFQGLVCDATARISGPDPSNPASTGPGSYYCYAVPPNKPPSWCSEQPAPLQPLKQNQTSLSLGPGGACGTFAYCDQSATGSCSNASSLKCLSCQAQVTVLQQIIPILYGIAQQVAAADYSYRDFYANSGAAQQENPSWQWIYSYCTSQNIPKSQCCIGTGSPASKCQSTTPPAGLYPPNDGTKTQSPSSDAVTKIYWPYWQQLAPSLGAEANFIKISTSGYVAALEKPLDDYIKAQTTNRDALTRVLAIARDNGWILAGGYYFQIATMNTGNLLDSNPPLAWAFDITKGAMKDLRNNVSAAATLITAASTAGTAGGGGATGGVSIDLGEHFSGISSAVSDTVGGVNHSFTTMLTGSGTEPLVAVQAWGQGMLIAAEVLFGVVIALLLILAFTGYIDVWVLGTGVLDPVGPAATIIMMFLIPGIYALIGILVGLGGLLAVYTPLIPYIVFAFGAIGWLISVIEAMVAGPLVALQVLVPSEHQGPLGKAEGALMLLFNVFLRPTLMIFGLMAAMLLAMVAMYLINAGFAIVWTPPLDANSLPQQPSPFWSPDPLKFILVIAAYVMLVLSVLNKCFAVITVIPSQVMRWIGGHGEGEQAPLGEIKGGVEAASQRTGAAGVGAAQKGEEAARSKRGQTEEKNANAPTVSQGTAPTSTKSSPGGGQSGGQGGSGGKKPPTKT